VSPAVARSFTITVASFRTAGRAEQIAAALQEQHFTTTTRVDRSGPWHQVIAGPYASLDAAREAQRALAHAGFPDALVSPSAVPAEPAIR
jgi:cell division septation protein DedD